MTGGLMNLNATGNENIILNGNPKKTFLKPRTISLRILGCKSLD